MLFRRKNKQNLTDRTIDILWPRRGFRRAWTYVWHRVTRISASPHVIAIGFAAGAFASFTPFVGFHFIIGAIFALIVGGNVLASALGTSVGNPITFPFIWFSTYNMGAFLLGYESKGKVSLTFPDGLFGKILTNPGAFWLEFWGILKPVAWPMLIGSIPLGLAIGTLVYVIVKPLVISYQNRRQKKFAEHPEVAKRAERRAQQRTHKSVQSDVS